MKIIRELKSKDGKSIKLLQQTHDRHIIETAVVNLDEIIICISTQIGCPLGCVFCATTKPIDNQKPQTRFIRNLNCPEICQQVTNVIKEKIPKRNKKPILLSYMGMGEPLLNYNNVICSIKKLALEYRQIKRATISTSGIRPDKIRRLAREKFPIQVKLHYSLHAPNDKLRKQIMPGAGPIKPALTATNYFAQVTGETVKVNYILIKGLNDSLKQADEFSKLLFPCRQNFVAKLTVFNDFEKYKKTSQKNFKKFKEKLDNTGIKTTTFIGNGFDIKASCGQLRRRFYKK